MHSRVENSPPRAPDYVLDITAEVCPLTFVRTKLLIERMAPGESADIFLKGTEPLANVPRAVAQQGLLIVDLAPFQGDTDNNGIHRLRIRKPTG